MQYPKYGDIELMKKWYDTDKYFTSKKWEENRELEALRPTFASLEFKSNPLKIAEVGMGNAIHSNYIYNNVSHINHLYLFDLNDPEREPALSLIKKDNVTFFKGDSRIKMQQLPNDMDLIYLDSSHDFLHVLDEIAIAWPKLKAGGILGGHDYDHFGVMAAVQTLNINLHAQCPKHITEYVEISECRDNHPGYPDEYKEYGFPLDWYIVKQEFHPNELNLKFLRNG